MGRGGWAVSVNSQFRSIWDLVISLLIIVTAFYIPWGLAFQVGSDFLDVFNYLVILFFSMDIILNFRTTYMNEDRDEIIKPTKIAAHYLKSPYFAIDVLSTIPFDLFHFGELNSGSVVTYIKLLKILRLLRLGKVLEKIHSNNFRLLGQLVYFMIIFILVIHWFALGWIGYSISEYKNRQDPTIFDTWLPTNQRAIESSSLMEPDELISLMYRDNQDHQWVIYLNTYYSITQLILGGEITPISQAQGFMSTLVVLLGQFIIASIYANMSMELIVGNQRAMKREFWSSQIQRLCQTRGVP